MSNLKNLTVSECNYQYNNLIDNINTSYLGKLSKNIKRVEYYTEEIQLYKELYPSDVDELVKLSDKLFTLGIDLGYEKHTINNTKNNTINESLYKRDSVILVNNLQSIYTNVTTSNLSLSLSDIEINKNLLNLYRFSFNDEIDNDFTPKAVYDLVKEITIFITDIKTTELLHSNIKKLTKYNPVANKKAKLNISKKENAFN